MILYILLISQKTTKSGVFIPVLAVFRRKKLVVRGVAVYGDNSLIFQ